MRESVIGSSRAMSGLQTGPHWCESVALSLVTLEQRGGRQGTPGCDGYLSGRVTASGKEVGGVGQPESPPSPPCLFTVGATVSPGDLCLCTPCPPVPPPATQTHSRETKNPHQLLPPIQSPRETLVSYINTHTHTDKCRQRDYNVTA